MKESVQTQQNELAGKYYPYPEYKDSGVEWLGEVPSEWTASRLKFIASIIMGQSPSSEDCNDLGIGNPFLQGNAEFGQRSPTPKQYCDSANKNANVGDFLFSVRAPVGAVNIADQRYGIGRGLCAIRSHEDIAPLYLWWVLQTSKIQFDAISTGSTFEAVSSEQVCNFALAIPSKNEQHTIATFLDYETARLDRLIAQQKRLIELLKEKRQAVISHAVTKGLNPNAPMKDSGIEWLGQVPEHWDVLPIQRLLKKVEQGSSPVAENRVPEDGEYGVLKISAIKKGKFITTEVKTLESFTHYNSRYKVKRGDLLVTRANTPSLVADVCVVDAEPSSPTMMSDLIYRLTTTDAVDNTFLCSWLLSDFGRMQIEIDARGSSMTMAKVSQGHIKSWLVILPPLGEQIEINTFLATKQEKFEKLIYKAESAISLMQERRTALIFAAVTGKVDVRDWERVVL
ncbi:restriction endonuclease subunit S [bacterium 19CA06SA08-2]|uniref:Restriction endonuclease subunit S n=1 Tax=bacterium 19CA06SA08-2 TaxID=2920658 RepID=A0AAU6U7W7_UNCXX